MRRSSADTSLLPLVAMMPLLVAASAHHNRRQKSQDKPAPPPEPVRPDIELEEGIELLYTGKVWCEKHAKSGRVLLRYKSPTHDLAVPLPPRIAVLLSKALHEDAAFVNKNKPR